MIALASKISQKVGDNINITFVGNTWFVAELPENSPRYVILSYELNHSDGRKSFPLVLVNWVPTSGEIGMMTLHASAFFDFQAAVCETPQHKQYTIYEQSKHLPISRQMSAK